MILDFVLNHSSSRHPWFESSRTGPASPRRDWYLWRPDAPDWRRPWDGAPVWHASGNEYFYAIFWSGMPDLNLANREVEAEMVDAMRFWLARGADGFRIDAARYLIETSDGGLADQFETHALAKRFRAALHAEYPEALFIAEAWTSMNAVAGYYGRANEYQLAFSFDLAEAIKSSINDGLRATLRQTLAASETTFPDRGFEAPFLSNHDMTRVMQVLGGDSARARLAAALLFAMPGTPFIYYGEELGMQGGLTPRDEDKRTPFRWDSVAPNYGFTTAARSWYGPTTEAAGADVASGLAGPASLLALYRTLIQVRAASPAFAEGDADLLESGDGRGVVALMRADPRGRALFVANLAAEPAGAFSAGAAGTPRVLLQEGLIGAPRSENGSVSIDGLAPRSFAFIALDE